MKRVVKKVICTGGQHHVMCDGKEHWCYPGGNAKVQHNQYFKPWLQRQCNCSPT